MVFLLGFWRNASLGSGDLVQVNFTCKGIEDKEQMLGCIQVTLL